jgi:predicted nucleic acid-binding protein
LTPTSGRCSCAAIDPAAVPEIDALTHALATGDRVLCTGLILQELLQGFSESKARRRIIEGFAALPLLNPAREDHIAAAELRNLCRTRGVQAGTIDALRAQLCIPHEFTILTIDVDLKHIAKHTSLQIWAP